MNRNNLISTLCVAPSKETQEGTRLIFRKHLLPLFGKFSLNYLNSNKQFVIEEFTIMSEQFANIRTFKAYFGQLFEVAVIMDYIDYNRIEKALKLISSPNQARLATRRKLLGESLTADELVAWLDAAKEDVENGKLKPQDYLLFLLTLHLGDRKAESYGLQWKHVDFNSGYVMIVQSLKKGGDVGPTKAHKETMHELPAFLLPLLSEWKKEQEKQLRAAKFDFTPQLFIFTYTTMKGEVNHPLHSDYLNYRLKGVYRRHKNLQYVTPHKLRHSFSTIARQGGASMQLISKRCHIQIRKQLGST